MRKFGNNMFFLYTLLHWRHMSTEPCFCCDGVVRLLRWVWKEWRRINLLVATLEGTYYGGFLKWWYPTTIGFPTKTHYSWVFWGYHHLRKHPYSSYTHPRCSIYGCMEYLPTFGSNLGLINVGKSSSPMEIMEAMCMATSAEVAFNGSTGFCIDTWKSDHWGSWTNSSQMSQWWCDKYRTPWRLEIKTLVDSSWMLGRPYHGVELSLPTLVGSIFCKGACIRKWFVTTTWHSLDSNFSSKNPSPGTSSELCQPSTP